MNNLKHLSWTGKWLCMSAAIGLAAACGGAEEGEEQGQAYRPSAQAGADLIVSTRAFVRLDGSGSRNIAGEPDGITYQWRQLSGPLVTFQKGAEALPSFTSFIAPWTAEDEALVFELIVNDNGSIDTDHVVVTVNGCAAEEGVIFDGCLAQGFGPLLAYEADSNDVGGMQFDSHYERYVQWRLRETDDPARGTVIEVTWNPLGYYEDSGMNGWFGVSADASEGADLSRYANGAVQFDMRVIQSGSSADDLNFRMECFYPCNSEEAWLKDPAQQEQWQTYTYSLASLQASGLDLTKVNTPFLIHPPWGNQNNTQIQIDNIRLLEHYEPPAFEAPAIPEEPQELVLFANGFADNNSDDEDDYYYFSAQHSGNNHLQVQSGELTDASVVLELKYTEPATQSTFMVKQRGFSSSDLTRFYHGEVLFDIRVVSYGGNEGEFQLNVFCAAACKALPWYNLGRLPEGEWQTLAVPVAELVSRGVDLTDIRDAFVLGFSGSEQEGVTVQLNNIRWQHSF